MPRFGLVQHIERALYCQATDEQVAVLFRMLINNANIFNTISITDPATTSSTSSSSFAATEDRLFEVYWTKMHPAGMDRDADLLAGLGGVLHSMRSAGTSSSDGRNWMDMLSRGAKVRSDCAYVFDVPCWTQDHPVAACRRLPSHMLFCSWLVNILISEMQQTVPHFKLRCATLWEDPGRAPQQPSPGRQFCALAGSAPAC